MKILRQQIGKFFKEEVKNSTDRNNSKMFSPLTHIELNIQANQFNLIVF